MSYKLNLMMEAVGTGRIPEDFDMDDCVPMCNIPTGSTCFSSSWDDVRDEDFDDDATSTFWGAGNDFDDDYDVDGPNSFQRDPGFFGARKETGRKGAVRAYLMELQQPAFSPSPGLERDLAPPGPIAQTAPPPSPPQPTFSPPIPRKWMAQMFQDKHDDSFTEPGPPIATPPGLAPPGLAPPPPAAPPSLGSRLHDSGLCKPCGWFRKAGGCKNGQLCHHCHICSRDDVKLRKSRRVQVLKNKLQQHDETIEQVGPAPSRRFSV
mmetsp:Transcript_97115/g.275121  ORF Transcript_97115/g.275121 Transcript_97115/m.275121 type:complete len:264 (+) Transcript_97115:94-885(+)